jgi:multiple sugar transport system substrate-binding protein
MRLTFQALILIIFITIFSSCRGRSESSQTALEGAAHPSSEPVTVEMLVYANEGMLSNYEEALKRFHQQQDGIRVDLKNQLADDWSDYDLAVRSKILGGMAPDIIDVSVVYRDALIQDGILLDLSPFIREHRMDLNLYFQDQFNGLRIDDRLYGIPSGALLMAVYINKELFREAGLTVPPLDWTETWSWDEFADYARKIRSLKTPDREVYGMTMSFDIGWIFPFLLANGSGFLSRDPDSLPVLDDASGQTFSFLRDLMFADGASPDMLKLISTSPFQYFMDGKVGFFVDGNWWMETLRNRADFEWGVVPMPLGKVPATGMYVDAWAVTSESDHPGEAFEVLKFFLQEEQQRSGIMKGIPLLKSSAGSIYAERYPDLDPKEIDVWFKGLEFGETPAYFYGWSDFVKESTAILQKYGFGEMDLESSMEGLSESYTKSR